MDFQKALNKTSQTPYDTLRYLQKYTGTDNVYLAKNGSLLLVRQIIQMGAYGLLGIAFANLIEPGVYGTYRFVLSFVGVLSIFTLPDMATALIRSVARGFEGSLISSLKTKIKWGMLGSLCCIIISAYYFYKGDTTLSLALLIAAAFLPFISTFSIYESLFIGRKKFNLNTIYSSVFQLIYSAVVIVSLLITKNILFLLIISFASNVLVYLALFIIALKKTRPNKKEDTDTIKYGKHLTLSSITSTVAMNIDQILIFHYLGATEVAIFFFASEPIEHLKSLMKNIIPLSLPTLSQQDGAEIKKSIFKKTLTFSLVTPLIIIPYILAAPFIFNIFLPKYTDAIIFSQVLALSLAATPLFVLYSALQAQRKIKELYVFNTLTPLASIAIMFILIPSWGLWGAVTSRIISRFINFAVSYALAKRI